MVSCIDKVKNNLQKFKSIDQSEATIGDRTNIMRQIMIDMTEFENLPPCLDADKKECILASKLTILCLNFCNNRRGLWVRYFLERRAQRHWRIWAQHCGSQVLLRWFQRCVAWKSEEERHHRPLPPVPLILQQVSCFIALIGQYRISQYHTEIELLTQAELTADIYIRVPVSLENFFVEGSYGRILQ